MATPICAGDRLTCDQGDAPARLTVVAHGGAVDGNETATVDDDKANANIPPMGTCKVLTAKALGTPTLCLPQPQGWKGPACGATLGGRDVLTSDHKCLCAEGGVIRVSPAGAIRLEVR